MKNKKIKNVILVTTLSFAITGTVFASEISFEKNNLSLSGVCENDVMVQLFADESMEKSAYSAGIKCENGNYEFSDDLSIWNIPEGNYAVVIDGNKNNVQNIDVKYEKKVLSEAQTTEQPVETGTEKDDAEQAGQETQESADIKFLGAFAVFQQSILDMRTWLADTEYPSWVKTGIDGALDGVDKLAGTISDMLFSADSPQDETVDEVLTQEQTMEASDVNTEDKTSDVSENYEASIDDTQISQ